MPPESLLFQHIYPTLALQTILQLCWQLRNLIASLMILGGGFNENFSSWGMQESQLSFKTD